MSRIPWDNKESLNTYPEIDRVNKWIDEDINETKEAIDDNSDRIDDLLTLNRQNGTAFNTKADAIAAYDAGLDGYPFQIYATTGGTDAGHWYFDSTSTDNVRFDRPFIESTDDIDDSEQSKVAEVSLVKSVDLKTENVNSKITGDLFYLHNQYYRNDTTTDDTSELTGYKCTALISLTGSDVAQVTGSAKGGSFDNIHFFDSSRVKISTLEIQTSISTVYLTSSNIPANTAYFAANAETSTNATIYINGEKYINEKIDDLYTKNNTLEYANNVVSVNTNGDFTKKGYWSKEGVFVKNTTYDTFRSTPILLYNDDTVFKALNTYKSTSLGNAQFFDENGEPTGFLEFQSSITSFTISSTTNTPPSGTVGVAFNALTSEEDKSILINDSVLVYKSVNENTKVRIENKNDLKGLFSKIGYYTNTGVFVSNSYFVTTELLPFTDTDSLFVENSAKGSSYNNFDFWDENEAYISGVNLSTSFNPIYIPQWNISVPSNTEYITINGLSSNIPLLKINRVTDVVTHQLRTLDTDWNNKEGCALGDSMTAARNIDANSDLRSGTITKICGVGSSSMVSNFTGVAVDPNGEYIDRRSNYPSDALFEAALAADGFTNEVTNPTWVDYSNNPSNYTLPPESYFLINSQMNGQDRINTLDTESSYIKVMSGTNDDESIYNLAVANAGTSTVEELYESYLGDIDDYGDGANGLPINFIGSYRLALSRINERCPNAKVILRISPKRTAEWDNTTKSRTQRGILFDKLRDKVREIGRVYGYEIMDFSKVLNQTNQQHITDGIHFDSYGGKLLGEKDAQYCRSISIFEEN